MEEFAEPLPMSEQVTHKLGPQPTEPPPFPLWDSLRAALEYHLLRSYRLPLYHAPLTGPELILDLGCASGHWVRNIAQQFANATVVGLDDQPTRLLPAPSPPNCRFISAERLASLPFRDHTFDYTHLDLLTLQVPITHWYSILREVMRVTKKEGWIEVRAMGIPRISHPIVWIWMAKVCRDLGFEAFPGKAIEKWLAHVGARDITGVEHIYQRNAALTTTSRIMISDGIALLDTFRDKIIAHGYASVREIEHELRVMQHNLLRTDRKEGLPIITVLAHPK